MKQPIKITGWWGEEPIWREETPEETLHRNQLKEEPAQLYQILNESL